LQVGRWLKISDAFHKVKRGVEDYTKTSIAGVESSGQESLSKKKVVKLEKLLASAKPDELHPEVKVERDIESDRNRETEAVQLVRGS